MILHVLWFGINNYNYVYMCYICRSSISEHIISHFLRSKMWAICSFWSLVFVSKHTSTLICRVLLKTGKLHDWQFFKFCYPTIANRCTNLCKKLLPFVAFSIIHFNIDIIYKMIEKEGSSKRLCNSRTTVRHCGTTIIELILIWICVFSFYDL